MDEALNTYLTFNVGSNIFGIHVGHVVEILEYQKPKSESTTLPFLLGLIEHRDDIIPMIDAAVKFGLPPMEVNPQTCIIVMSINNADHPFNIALQVDQVSDVVEIDPSKRKNVETQYKPGYVDFVSKFDDDFVMVINVDKVFTDTDIIMLSKIMEGNEN